MKKHVLLAVIAMLVFVACNRGETAAQPTPAAENGATLVPETALNPTSPVVQGVSTSDMETASDSSDSTVKEFTITGSNVKFDLQEMRVRQGDTVRVTFVNSEGTHDWVIDQFETRTKILDAGQLETVEFVADKAGTYEFYCSVGAHRAMGMKGNLIVE